MISSLPKRPASASPDADRPVKRMVTSSPEEGELDDATPPPVARSPSPPKTSAKSQAKVPFPFKKKPTVPESSTNGAVMERPSVYERDEERRFREEDTRRRFGLPPRPERVDDRHGRSWAGDRWEPGPERYDRPRWESQTYVPDSRAYAREPERRPYRSPSPPRHLERRRPSRSRSPPSPRSASTPRSPLTPSSAKEKHRLPPSRPVLPNPATYRAVYDQERWGDEDDRWGRRRDPLRDGYDDYRDRREGRGKQQPGRIRVSDHNRSDPAETYALRSPSPVRLQSPPARLISPRATPEQNDDAEPENGQLPPPRPNGIPPPVPPDMSGLLPKPPTPLDRHSPQPVLLSLPRIDSGLRTATSAVPPELSRKSTSDGQAIAVVRRPRRKPIHRTREQEQQAYGRVFVGCGQQSDYTVMTKLGEGTFGCVAILLAEILSWTLAI